MRSIFQQKVRGFRVIDLGAFVCLTVLVLGVYAFKAHAGGEGAKIAEADAQILDEQRRIRILDAELAHLEQPARLEQLSTQYLGLAPVVAKHETSADSLMEIARQAATPPATPSTTKSSTAKAATGKPAAAKPASVRATTATSSIVKLASAKTQSGEPDGAQPSTDPQ